MRIIFLSFICVAIGVASFAEAAGEDIGGQVVGDLAGERYALPLLKSDIAVEIAADMATVEIAQTFVNDAHLPMAATYLFPLNQHAAVYAMEMRIGDEVVSAVIKERAAAQASFDRAAAEGKAAALLTQHRPNMFTQKIANLMPGLPVTVRLRYVQMVPKIDGRHELVVPLVVGPRYQDAPAPMPPEVPDVQTDGAWSVAPVPVHPPVLGRDLPQRLEQERVSLALKMVGGLPITDFGSASHPLTIEETDDGLSAQFAEGRVLDNKDLVIGYELSGAQMQAASLSHRDARGGFVSLMVEPPKSPGEETVTPRELVFVLDTSGSMGGLPMRASKVFMDRALRGLRPGDYFRVIPFSDSAQSYSADAQPASAQNIRAARSYVSSLRSGGGTQIDNAIRTAFATRQPKGTIRIVVFLSDGYIGNEAQVLRTLKRQIGQSRVYAFGIGNAVNRYLLDEMAQVGRGYARYVPAGEDATEAAQSFAADLKSPLLTDISIDWGGLEVHDVTPARLPDLFAGQSLRVYARHSGEKSAQVTIRGRVQGRAAQMPVTLDLSPGAGGDATALPLIWARNRIASLSRDVALDQNAAAADDEITRLGLAFSLQTQNTSFVAVSQNPVTQAGQSATPVAVPLSRPAGVPAAAFSGSSTPEPQTILGLLIVAVLSLFRMRRWRQSAGLALDKSALAGRFWA